MNPFDEHEIIDIALISTWIKPFIVSGIIFVFTLMLIPQLEGMDDELSLLSCASPILALMCVLLVEFMPVRHKTIHTVSKQTGLIFVFYILYWHIWDNTQWHTFNGSFFVFCQSVGVVCSCGFIDKMYQKNHSKKIIRLGQIFLTGLFLILPNVYNINTEKTVWETIVRIVLFVATSWFQLFAAVVFEDDVDTFQFFNSIWWILIVQRYFIPIVAFVWMNSILRVTKKFSTNNSVANASKKPAEQTPLLDCEEAVPVSAKTSPVVAREPTQMFAQPPQAGEPRQRTLRRNWKTHQGLTPQLTPQQQLLKLQELATGVDAV